MAKYSKAAKISKRIAKQIARNERALMRLSEIFGKKLYKQYREYVNRFSLDENGNILNNPQNIALANNSKAVTNQVFNSGVSAEYNKLFNDAFLGINNKNAEYYSYIMGEDIDQVTNQVNSTMSAVVGTGDFAGNGLIQQLLDPSEISRKIQNTIIKSVTSQDDIKVATKTLKSGIVGDDEKMGFAESYYYQNANDSFSEYERISSDNYSTKLQLNYAIYQGGEIKSTRSFCESRNGKVFNRETIESWQNLDWQGKKKDHNILIDAGGYNCRHYYDWVSYALARRLDPDIEKSKYDK